MEYQALYRKYRPQRFDDVVGQGHVTETLAREVIEGKVAHAYLFAGPRGTGKTTSARIIAKSLNCPNRAADGEPCNTCESCVAVTNGTSMDVVELDAASHNKVEDVRDIRVSVSTVASVGGAKRVFILDEAHMLTKAAGNALLKTLEEPPDHVHFVLATTEPYKLLDTIRSRSQRFDFHPVSVETLAGHLAKISALESYEVEDGSLLAIARQAGGSVRDSMSLLEQVAALGGGSVTDAGVRRALGLAGRDAYLRIASAAADGDAKKGLELVAELASQGIDLRQFVGDAIGFFRGTFLTQYGKSIEELVDEPPDVIEDWGKAAALLQPAEVLRTVDLLSEALMKLREGREERLMLELAVLKLTRPEVADDAASLSARVARLERGGVTPGVVAPIPSAANQSSQSVTGESRPDPESGESADEAGTQIEVLELAEPEAADQLEADESASEIQLVSETEPSGPTAVPTTADLLRVWPQLVAAVRGEMGARREALFREASPDGVEGTTVVLTVPAHLDFHLEQLRDDRQLGDFVTAAAHRLLGHSVVVEFRSGNGEASAGGPADRAADEPDSIPDKDALREAPAGGTDPVSLLETELGAEVVDDPDTESD